MKKHLRYLWFFVIIFLMEKSISQELKQISPFVLPEIIVVPGKFYILTHGISDFYKQKLNIQNIAVEDTAVVIYEFLPAKGVFRKVSIAPFVRHFFNAAFHKGKIYVAGGYDSKGQATNTLYEFDLSLHKWLPQHKTMPTKRAEFVFETVGDKIYAIGGNKHSAIEVYDITTDKWSKESIQCEPNVQLHNHYHGAAVIDNYIYLFAHDGVFHIYDTRNKILRKGEPAPFNNKYFSVACFNRKIYIAGGVNAQGIDYNVYLYSTIDNMWYNAGRIATDLCGAGLIIFGQMLIYTGGSTTNMIEKTSPVGAVFIYRPIR